MEVNGYGLHSKFNIELHKQTFINYLEVIILSDGTVEYAVPSHQEKLIKIACKKLRITKANLFEMCPLEYHFDVITWLCKITGAVSVWSSGIEYYQINEKQKNVLKRMKINGLYKGIIT